MMHSFIVKEIILDGNTERVGSITNNRGEQVMFKIMPYYMLAKIDHTSR